ncbi:MAG: NAD+ synthase [Pseudomonadota bacterium]
MSSLNIIMAQINPLVGDIPGNTELVQRTVCEAVEQHQADVVVFSELMLTAYPPEDLLLRDSMTLRIDKAIKRLLSDEALHSVYVVIGYPKKIDGALYNLAGVLYQGEIIAEYAKQHLPNYQVFDEKRYFEAGSEACVFDLNGIPTALTVCEDMWQEGPMAQAKDAGAKLMLNLNASPYYADKQNTRIELVKRRALEGNMPIVYVNQLGGQDELVFDGGSMVINAQGEFSAAAPNFRGGLFPVVARYENDQCLIDEAEVMPPLPEIPSIYEALVLGVRDYVNKIGFKSVILGLSGGIDSGLTCAIAADAIGAENVHAVMMPFRYTSDISKSDAQEQADMLGVNYDTISIEPVYDSFMQQLAPSFEGTSVGLTEQNLQARTRGVILMGLSNKFGHLLLTTGNKSEMSVGYATLYGDMCGGFNPLKDVSKMRVYALAEYRNTLSMAIPERVITRAPSAELAPDQVDSDSLPPYEILDQILELYVEQDLSAQAIINCGFEQATVEKVLKLVDRAEYKRRQAVIGVRITPRGFGRDRRYPITSGWKLGE